VGRAEPSRHNALQSKLAGVPEHGRALSINVLVERDPGRLAGEQPGELLLELAN
jgi:hypothetical protein